MRLCKIPVLLVFVGSGSCQCLKALLKRIFIRETHSLATVLWHEPIPCSLFMVLALKHASRIDSMPAGASCCVDSPSALDDGLYFGRFSGDCCVDSPSAPDRGLCFGHFSASCSEDSPLLVVSNFLFIHLFVQKTPLMTPSMVSRF